MAYLFTAGRQGYDSYAYHYGYVNYTVTDSSTSVTVTLNSVGERMTVNNDAYSSYSYKGTSTVTGTIDNKTIKASHPGPRNCTSRDTYISFGGTSVTATFAKGTSATTKTLNISWTWNGTTTTDSVNIPVGALQSYTVSYNANGGTGAPSSQTKYHGIALTLRTGTPTKTDYTFQGWSTSSTSTSASYQPGGSYTKNESTTLYAIWKKDITLSYDANNGEGAPASQSVTIYNNAANPTFTISSTRPTRTNYDFLGWSLSDIATTASYQPNGSITLSDSDTLYAVWKLAYIASTISDISAVRCDSDGTSNDEGTHGKLTFKVSKYSDGSSQNYPTVSAKYDVNRKITFEDPTAENNIQTYTSNTFELSGDNQHNIVITKQDGSYGTKTFSTYISAKFFVIDITEDGTGIGFLTSAPSSGINIASAIKGLGIAGLTASGAGGIAIGTRASSYTITSAGSGSVALGYAQGGNISATTKGSFAGGLTNGTNIITASNSGAFAFGQSSSTAALTASGNGSIAMGIGCTSIGDYSLTHNMYTTATGRAQTVLGTWNIIDSATTSTHPTGISNVAQFKKYAFIIGNGVSDSARSNAFAVTWDGKVELNSEPLFKWTQIGSGNNTTSKITFSSATTNYNEIMVVASTLRSGGYHLFSGVLPATIIDDTEREFKLSGGTGSSTATNCGAWGKIVKTGFTPVGVWINNTAFSSSTTWYIYGR